MNSITNFMPQNVNYSTFVKEELGYFSATALNSMLAPWERHVFF